MAKKIEQRQVSFLTVSENQAKRRLDNFLISHFGSLPRSRIYRMIRTGEIRVNKGRIKQDYRLQTGDIIRIPPMYITSHENPDNPSSSLSRLIEESIIHEDECIIVINKPENIAVHSGSGVRHGVIEILRSQRPKTDFLELAHRLDRATSGCLLIAKGHKILTEIHSALKNGEVKKTYLALLKGRLTNALETVDLPLSKKKVTSDNKKVRIDKTGKQALTHFHLLKLFNTTSLSRIELMTGRTHQIRVHAAAIHHPLAGDKKYGDWEFNCAMKKSGLKRLFLHAQTLSFKLPSTSKQMNFTTQLPDELQQCLDKLS